MLHRDRWVSGCDESSWVSVGGLASNLMSRRMALALRRMLETSCRTELGQRSRGRVLLERAGASLCGNMVMAVSIASPRIAWRVWAKSKMCVFVSCEVSRFPSGEMAPVGNSIESMRERDVALASIVAVYESTITLDFHSARVCSGIGYWNMGTRGDCALGGAMAAAKKMGRLSLPRTP